ncbi:MAG: membrane protein [Lysobacterales bacterium]|nr:MAG: membrane protein [Xanthomonadales bacterium]
MAIALLAAVVALALGHLAPELARLRRYDWFSAWLGLLARAKGFGEPRLAELALLGLLLPPLLILGLLLWLLAQPFHGALAFLAAIALLFYAWGPRDLDRELEAILAADGEQAREAALRALLPHPAQGEVTAKREAVLAALAAAGLRRWFAVLFWFFVLGPLGALGYRLTQILAEVEHPDRVPTGVRAAASRLLALLDWLPARLVAFSLALVGDFDAVVGTLRRRFAEAGFLTLERGFLWAAMDAAVPRESEEEAGDPISRVLVDGQRRHWRVLLLWFAVVALLALGGATG